MAFGLALVFAAFIFRETIADSCMYYQFETQPPLTLTCDPYNRIRNSDAVAWRLRFRCEVSRLSNDAGSFDVHWFRRDPNTQAVTDLGRLETIQSGPDKLKIQYGGNIHILNDDFMESMLGDYWCQVINTTTQPHTYLGMSNVLTILHPDQYDLALPDCMTVRNETVTCADVMMDQNEESISPSLSTFSSMHQQSTELFRSSSSKTRPSSSYSITNTVGVLITTTNEEHVGSTSTDQTPSIFPITSSTSIATSVLTTERVIRTTSTTFNERTSSIFTNNPSPFVVDVTSQTSIATGITGFSTSSALLPNPLSAIPQSMALSSSNNGVFISQSESPMGAQDLVTNSDTHLIMAASVGGAMLILIIILLTIIMVLLCTTNKKRTAANPSGGCSEDNGNNEFQRMSSIRSSQRPLLLDSTNVSLDSQHCLTTSYTCGDMIPDHAGASLQPHHYSVIRGSSFEPNPVPSQQQSKDVVVSDMTDNLLYNSNLHEELFLESIRSHNMNLEGAAAVSTPNQYSSLKNDKNSDKSPQSDGYNKLRQQKLPSPSDNGAYSTLYDPNTTSPQTSPHGQDTTAFPVTEPYNTLNHSINSVNQLPTGRIPNEPSFKVLSPSNEGANIYDEVLNEQNPATVGFDDPQYYSSVVQPSTKNTQDKKQTVTKKQQAPPPVAAKKKKGKTAAIVPPQYRGDYERDPSYVPHNHH